MAKDIKLKKLPGKPREFFYLINSARYELWMASDHLVFLKRNQFTEECKRFYFNDVQAITVTRTRTNLYVIIGLVVAAAFFAFLAMIFFAAIKTNAVPGAIFSIIAFVPLIMALATAAMGPTCVTRVHTAVQVERLYSLSRVRMAEKTLAILVPLIERSQGRLASDVLDRYPDVRIDVMASPFAFYGYQPRQTNQAAQPSYPGQAQGPAWQGPQTTAAPPPGGWPQAQTGAPARPSLDDYYRTDGGTGAVPGPSNPAPGKEEE